VQQARLQVINGERQVASAANAAKPEIDLYGSYESRGVVIPGLITIGRRWVDRKCDYRSDSNGGSRSSTLFEAGIQFFLPIQDRVARANLGADKALLRQQVRVTQLESQVAAEVQNAITALHAAESAADAAKDARAAGEATWRLSGEFQRWLRDQPLAHRAANLPGTGANHGGDGQSGVAKAAVQLDRVLGGTLEKSGISLKADQDESRPATALIRQSIAQSLAIRLMDMWHLTRASETQDCQSTYRGTAAA